MPLNIRCNNIEPDGRLLIEQGQQHIVVPVFVIDALVNELQKQCTSEGEGYGFLLDVDTGEIFR